MLTEIIMSLPADLVAQAPGQVNQSSGSSTLDNLISAGLQLILSLAGLYCFYKAFLGGGNSSSQAGKNMAGWVAMGIGAIVLGQVLPNLTGLGNSVVTELLS